MRGSFKQLVVSKMAFDMSSAASGGSMSSKVDADNPPFSRVFIVCGRSTTAEEVRETFAAYGTVEDVWMVKDKMTKENKGICFVKYSKASSAALAIEYLDGKIIGNDTKPIKAMIAQSKTPGKHHEAQNDSDLSRVFVLCPKSFGDEDLRAKFIDYSGDIEYVQIVKDHETRESKGVAYVKFTKPATAALAIETCDKSLKAVIAEPKSAKSSRQKGAKEKVALSAFAAAMQAMPMNPYLEPQNFGYPMQDPNNSMMAAQAAVSESITNSITSSFTNTRLFVIVSPTVTQEQLSSLFDLVPGMEYCDLKRNHNTRDSRGIAYILYKSMGSAIYAKEKLNGFEYPPGSKLVVKFAEDHPNGNKNNGAVNFQQPFTGVNTSFTGVSTGFTGVNTGFTGVNTSPPMPVVSPLSFNPLTASAPAYQATGASSAYTTAVLPDPQPFADPHAEVAARLFVVCQPRAPPEQVLKDVFSRFGDLIDVWMVGDRNFGYAKFAQKEAADAAIESLNEHEVLGMKIKVLHADPPKTEGSRKRPRV